MLKEEITLYKNNICTPLNDECNDFIWGNFIDESVVVGLEEFWHNQTILNYHCLLYTSPSPRDPKTSRMPSSA